uniref:RxLR effector candidate protein n=1 Tax=Hyaloperonospora arabidopsidis (strain Emoy2) TaxID=559515 RepID=M4C1U9_HYAAE
MCAWQYTRRWVTILKICVLELVDYPSSDSSTCAVITKKVPYPVDSTRICTFTVDSISYYENVLGHVSPPSKVNVFPLVIVLDEIKKKQTSIEYMRAMSM